jgi:hypothetical protein
MTNPFFVYFLESVKVITGIIKYFFEDFKVIPPKIIDLKEFVAFLRVRQPAMI